MILTKFYKGYEEKSSQYLKIIRQFSIETTLSLNDRN